MSNPAIDPRGPASPLYSPDPVDWVVTPGYVDYRAAEEEMEAHIAAIKAGDANERIWLLEHEPLFTAGTSAKPHDLLAPEAFPVFKTSRGGQYTYHGPGQRVAYAMLNLEKRGRDVRLFVHGLEDWIIGALSEFSIRGEKRADRVGVWVDRTEPGGPIREDKIAAIGVRIRRWVSFHGISLNVEPDLSHFSGITPCGISEPGLGVTSLVDLGLPASMDDADAALKASFERIFGPTAAAEIP